MKDVDSETELKDAFRVLDKDGLGYIRTDAMQKICKRVRPPQPAPLGEATRLRTAQKRDGGSRARGGNDGAAREHKHARPLQRAGCPSAARAHPPHSCSARGPL